MFKQKIIIVILPLFLLRGTCGYEDSFFYCTMFRAYRPELCVHGELIVHNLGHEEASCECVCDEGWKPPKCDTPDDGGGHGNPHDQDGKITFSQIQFENQSSTSASFDVILDDTWITSISPGEKSESLEVETGKHHVVFRITGTSTRACLNDEVVLEPGKRMVLTCNT